MESIRDPGFFEPWLIHEIIHFCSNYSLEGDLHDQKHGVFLLGPQKVAFWFREMGPVISGKSRWNIIPLCSLLPSAAGFVCGF